MRILYFGTITFVSVTALWLVLWLMRIRIRFSRQANYPQLLTIAPQRREIIFNKAREAADADWRTFLPTALFAFGLSLGTASANGFSSESQSTWLRGLVVTMVVASPFAFLSYRAEIEHVNQFLRRFLSTAEARD